MDTPRIAQFRDHLPNSGLTDEVSSLVLATLSVIEQLRVSLYDREAKASIYDIEHDSAEVLDALRTVLSAPAESRNQLVVDWSLQAAARLGDLVNRVLSRLYLDDDGTTRHVHPSVRARLLENRDDLEALKTRATLAIDILTLRAEAHRLVQDTREALAVATEASERATDAAGLAGTASLSSHFDKYSRGERNSANVFRVLTVLAVIAGALGIVIQGDLESGSWAGITYRLAIAGAAAGLAAYFGRQAGQHRRMYNWAKSMAVQLQSFPAFIEPLDGDVRAEVYRTFSRRVLSAPPEKSADSHDDSVGVAQLLDVVTALAKRNVT